MKSNFWKKLLLIVPIIILVVMLFFIDYTVNYFKDVTVTFVYDTNAGSVKRFSKEMRELSLKGYTHEQYGELYTSMIHIYNKTLGEKDSIVTFLLYENGQIYHSNEYNEAYILRFLDNQDNINLINQVTTMNGNGEVKLKDNIKEQTWFYQIVTDGTDKYYLFMGVDIQRVEAKLSANEIIIPIGIMGLLLLVTTEHLIWLKMVCNPRQKEGEK